MANFVAVDFEKWSNESKSICALGVAVVEDSQIVENSCHFFHPTEEVTAPSIHYGKHHFVRPEDVQGQPTLGELWPELCGYFKGHRVIAHCAASMEKACLEAALSHYGISVPDIQWGCSRDVAREIWSPSGGNGLKDVARHLGIEFVHHRPEDDARVSATIILRALEESGLSSVDELLQQTNAIPRRHASGRYDYLSYEISGAAVTLSIDPADFLEDDETSDEFIDEALVRRRCPDQGHFERGCKLKSSPDGVRIVEASETECIASVKGSGTDRYHVSVNAKLEATCNCRSWQTNSDRFCKHCAAVALAWIDAKAPEQIPFVTSDFAGSALKQLLLQEVSGWSGEECRRQLLDMIELWPDDGLKFLLEALGYDPETLPD